MPVFVLAAEKMEVGTHVRSHDGTHVRVVTEVERKVDGRFAGRWIHKVRRATDEEKLASDVIQS